MSGAIGMDAGEKLKYEGQIGKIFYVLLMISNDEIIKVGEKLYHSTQDLSVLENLPDNKYKEWAETLNNYLALTRKEVNKEIRK